MIRKEKKDRHSTMTKIRKRSKRQTIIYKTLHRKLKIKRREIPPPPNRVIIPCSTSDTRRVTVKRPDPYLILYNFIYMHSYKTNGSKKDTLNIVFKWKSQ